MKIEKIVKDDNGEETDEFTIHLTGGETFCASDIDWVGKGYMSISCNICPQIDFVELMDAGKALQAFAYLLLELQKEFPDHEYDTTAQDDDHEWCMSLDIGYEEWEQIYEKYKV